MTPGCLYDLTLRGTKNDQLTIFSPSKQQGRISYIRIGDDQKSVITHVSPALSGGLTKTHTYSIKEGEYGISVTSNYLMGLTKKFLARSMIVGQDFVNQENLALWNGLTPSILPISVAMLMFGFRVKTEKHHKIKDLSTWYRGYY